MRLLQMNILISNQSELPIYAQIREQIKEQILNGAILAGEVLPSIRMLAKETGVSVITTTRAYNELEQEGFISSMQGKGSVVLSIDNKVLSERFRAKTEEHLEQAVNIAKKAEISLLELQDMLTILYQIQ